MVDNFVCKREVLPVRTWMEGGEKDGNCPPCLIKPLAELYLGKLEDVSDKEHIELLHNAWSTNEALTIADALDKIKSEVGDKLKKDLVLLDCMAQSHKDQ